MKFAVITEEVIKKLEDGFLKGFNDREACLYSDIAPSTLYEYCNANLDFSERKEELKENVKMRAKMNIAKEIEEGDKVLSQWYLERRDKDFNPKSAIEHSGKIENTLDPKKEAAFVALEDKYNKELREIYAKKDGQS